MPAEGTTKVHIRFKGGKIQTLTIMSPKSSAQQVKTQPGIVELVDKLLDKHIYSEIAELLNVNSAGGTRDKVQLGNSWKLKSPAPFVISMTPN